jgi:hypothetical protein
MSHSCATCHKAPEPTLLSEAVLPVTRLETTLNAYRQTAFSGGKKCYFGLYVGVRKTDIACLLYT